MENGHATRLQLADPGWVQIDTATLRVRGALDAIVREMDQVLSDEAVRALCSNLGILSTGFYFIDPLGKYTRFFKNEQGQQRQTYGTQYLWSNEEAGRTWSGVIHRLFVHMRTIQQKQSEAEGRRTEDFFRYVPKEKDISGMGDPDKRIRLEHMFHYVPLGEMLFTMILWHSLLVAVDRGDGVLPLERLSVGLDDAWLSNPKCLWRSEDMLKADQAVTTVEESNKFALAWQILCGGTRNLASVWRKLNIYRSGTDKRGVEFDALVAFTNSISAVAVVNEESLSSEDLNAKIQTLVAIFLRQLVGEQSNLTISDALQLLERYARFPILPFYFWTGLDGAPKCYLVSPVWTSQQYGVKVDDPECPNCRHLGLALSATLPLAKIDWTLPDGISLNDRVRCSDAEPLVVSNVIRLMARPLVEEHLYSTLVREIKASHKSEIIDLVRKEVAGG